MKTLVITPKISSIEEILEVNIQNNKQGTLSIKKKTKKGNSHALLPF